MIEQTSPQRKGSLAAEAEIGWLAAARVCPSPNCDARPDAAEISLLVIHNISLPPGKFGGRHIDQLFTNTLDAAAHPYFAQVHTLRVSSHLLIDRRGRLTQYVPLQMRAWHAGVSTFDGRERCNDFSIGIELEGCDDQPFTQKQYRRLISVTRTLLQTFPALTSARITGHSDIAPGRKTDPGPHFDWAFYRAALRAPAHSRS